MKLERVVDALTVGFLLNVACGGMNWQWIGWILTWGIVSSVAAAVDKYYTLSKAQREEKR